MKPQHLLVSVAALSCRSLSVSAFSKPRSCSPRSMPGERRIMRHSSESVICISSHGDTIDARALSELELRIFSLLEPSEETVRIHDLSPGRSCRSAMSLEEASSQHGMPWTTTIGRTDEVNPLLYMPFWNWQLDFMKLSLTNLHPIECSTLNDVDVSYNENKEKRARIVNHCYASNEYRKIRMTYYDAGDSVQVFNSVWYPDAKYNLPVLGIDLLSFNRKKYLAIVDFQPLHQQEDHHSVCYEHVLKPIKSKYETLKGRMSSRFYDETQFFSNEMLFARFEDATVVHDDLFPAFQSYVRTHVELVQSMPQTATRQTVQHVFERQQAYDTYSAERDPAAGLFAAMFGKDWAEDFIYDFLFSLSERKASGLNLSPPSFGGPPPPAAVSTLQGSLPEVTNGLRRDQVTIS